VSSYATPADLALWGMPIAGFGGLFNTAQQQSALDGAADVIDGYLRDHYTLPLLVPYALSIRRACAIIAAYDLITTRGYDPAVSQNEQIRERYAATIRWLEQISKGQISPPMNDSSPGGIVGGPLVQQATTMGSGSQSQVSGASSSSGAVVLGPPALRGWK
jgi:phage gp36-like protein